MRSLTSTISRLIGTSLAVIALVACGAAPSTSSQLADHRGEDRQINCSSSRYRYAECLVDGDVHSVQLVQQLSSSACVEGRTFGALPNGMWVNRGCQGNFRLVVNTVIPIGPPLATMVVPCASSGYRRTQCDVDVPILALAVSRQVSRSACREGQSFGFSGTVIGVDRGCRAEFLVTYPGDTIVIDPHR